MKKYRFTVFCEPQEEGGYTVTVPSLPGCISEGDTFEEAQVNIAEAIESYLGSLMIEGDEIPVEEKEEVVSSVNVIFNPSRFYKSLPQLRLYA